MARGSLYRSGVCRATQLGRWCADSEMSSPVTSTRQVRYDGRRRISGMRETVRGMATDSSAPARTVRAPRGTSLSCKGWQQEAALRMLMNNLDPEVAEKPQELIVYGGTGKAARNWECFHAIVRSL